MSKGMTGFQKQARVAECTAMQSADAVVADQMRNLAEAFSAQADIMKKKRKKKNELCRQS